MAIPAALASQCVLATTPKVPLISGLVVKVDKAPRSLLNLARVFGRLLSPPAAIFSIPG
jgi:hypothetical protein